MEPEIRLSKVVPLALILLVSIMAISSLILIRNRYSENLNEKEVLSRNAFSGSVIQMTNLQRGNFDVTINAKEGVLTIKAWQIGWEVKKFNLQTGDSVKKAENSADVFFYKSFNGQFRQLCVCKLF
jgi:hypothetical protein